MGKHRKKADEYGVPFVMVSGISMNALPDGVATSYLKGNGKAMNMKGIDPSLSIGRHFGGLNSKDGQARCFTAWQDAHYVVLGLV
jgi:hypothetical protein